MGETEEDKQYVLDNLGTWLTFNNFNIQALPEINITALFQGNNIVNGTEDRNFTFITTSKLCNTSAIDVGLSFTMQDDTYLYYFSVASRPTDALDNWAQFMADYIRRENV